MICGEPMYNKLYITHHLGKAAYSPCHVEQSFEPFSICLARSDLQQCGTKQTIIP